MRTLFKIVYSSRRTFDGGTMVDLLRQQGLLGYSIAEVCRESGFGRTTVYAAIKNGDLVARKYGRRTVVLRDDLANFLQNLPSIVPANLNRRGDQ